ncbi:hypothetical protein [Bradyrhizobium sp. Tv2a-2]|uniref:hypothetical protein n=1 Tax=Bradyrhizobium sp. Tv2a-2 TaxID=113395 RepID=UPI0004021D13|nr:hypothetical protein [Bradyrhizobium sp. Tv2a-2]
MQTIASDVSVDEKLARFRAHRNNIHRYRRLLSTELSDVERAFIARRLAEEHDALNKLSELTFPLVLRMPALDSTDQNGA